MLRCQHLHPVDCEGDLKIDRLFGPQGTVIIEDGDSFGGLDIVQPTLARDTANEFHYGGFGCAVVPGWKRI